MQPTNRNHSAFCLLVASVQHVIHLIAIAYLIMGQDSHHKGIVLFYPHFPFYIFVIVGFVYINITIFIRIFIFVLCVIVTVLLFLFYWNYLCSILFICYFGFIFFLYWYIHYIYILHYQQSSMHIFSNKIIHFSYFEWQRQCWIGVPFATRSLIVGQMALRLDVGVGASTSSPRSSSAFARPGTCASIQLGRMA